MLLFALTIAGLYASSAEITYSSIVVSVPGGPPVVKKVTFPHASQDVPEAVYTSYISFYSAATPPTFRFSGKGCVTSITLNDRPMTLSRMQGYAPCNEYYNFIADFDGVAREYESNQLKIVLRNSQGALWYNVTVNNMLTSIWQLVLAFSCVLIAGGTARFAYALYTTGTLTFRYDISATAFRWFVVLAGIAVIVTVKSWFMEDKTSDYYNFLRPWFEHIRRTTIWRAYGTEFSNYAPFYTYLLGIAQQLTPRNIDSLYPVKFLTFAGEALASVAAYKLVALRYPAQSLRPLVAALLLPLLPAVLANGASVGQCDVFHAAFLLWAVYFVARNKPLAAMVFVGLAISFKALGIFIAPFVLALLLRGRLSWPYLLMVPLVYVLLMLPSVMEGRDWMNLLTVYLRQANTYPSFSFNAASAYYFVPNGLFGMLILPALFISLMLSVAYAFRSAAKIGTGDVASLLLIATLGAELMFFASPKMLDRYQFGPETMAFVLAFMYPRLWPAALLFQIGSVGSYGPGIWRYHDWFFSHASRMPYMVLANFCGLLCLWHAWKRLPESTPPAAINRSSDV